MEKLKFIDKEDLFTDYGLGYTCCGDTYTVEEETRNGPNGGYSKCEIICNKCGEVIYEHDVSY